MPPETTCRELVELVTDYLEGATPPAVTGRVEAHLLRCPDCPAYVEQMRRTVRALGALPRDSISPATKRGLVRLFRRHRLGDHPSSRA